jgi:hypothetical protein
MAAAQRNTAAYKRIRARGPHAMTTRAGRYTVLIHPSTAKKGWWQATYFDEKMEPWGDSESPTWERLLDTIRYEMDWTEAKAAKARPNQGHLPYLTELADTGHGDFEDYYPLSAAGEVPHHESDLYFGRNVIWVGDEGRMLKVDPDYAQHTWGNTFDKDKLAAVVSGIENADDRVMFYAPYGDALRIELEDVKESQEGGWEDDSLDRPYTTGDEELDRYLVDPEDVLSEYGDEPGDEAWEEAREDIGERLQEAVADNEGDLGQWAITIRDGNHRSFGALIAGEPYVYVMLSDDQWYTIKGRADKGQLTEQDVELLEMLD